MIQLREGVFVRQSNFEVKKGAGEGLGMVEVGSKTQLDEGWRKV